jgi:hypothetical protein
MGVDGDAPRKKPRIRGPKPPTTSRPASVPNRCGDTRDNPINLDDDTEKTDGTTRQDKRGRKDSNASAGEDGGL